MVLAHLSCLSPACCSFPLISKRSECRSEHCCHRRMMRNILPVGGFTCAGHACSRLALCQRAEQQEQGAQSDRRRQEHEHEHGQQQHKRKRTRSCLTSIFHCTCFLIFASLSASICTHNSVGRHG
eukprot:COSAG04_NODE_16106_length_509_cov_6.287805_1_plen_124_part_01